MAYKNKVTSITIKGYKSIKSLDNFELSDLNVMIGGNGAGKSNLISLFKFLNEISEGHLQSLVRKSGGANTFLHFGSKQTPSLEVKVNFGPNSYWLKLAPTSDDSLYFEEEGCSYQGPGYANPFKMSVLSSDRKETGLPLEKGKVSASTLESIKSWKLYHFHDTSDTALMKKTGPIDDNSKLKADASNLAAYLYLLEKKYPQDFNNITDTIRSIAPFFDKFILRPSPLKPDSIQLEWKHKNSDNYFNGNSLSDGTLRFMCLTTLLLQPEEKMPTTVLLDEPELGLHPAAIQFLANLLKSAATRTQVIVSTQSVTLINQLKPESIIVVNRTEEQSFFKKLTVSELSNWLEDYGVGDMWEKNIIGGRP
ncbi:MAG: AAA family ATPase [Patescibacteria group bacterium]